MGYFFFCLLRTLLETKEKYSQLTTSHVRRFFKAVEFWRESSRGGALLHCPSSTMHKFRGDRDNSSILSLTLTDLNFQCRAALFACRRASGFDERARQFHFQIKLLHPLTQRISTYFSLCTSLTSSYPLSTIQKERSNNYAGSINLLINFILHLQSVHT